MADATETADEFRARVRAWYDDNATPRTETDPWAVNVQADQDAERHHFEESRRWQSALAAAGFMGIAWPAEYGGGGGASWMTRIEREISRDYEEYTGFPGATTAMLGPALLRHGSEEQKRGILPKVLSAELTFCQLFSEPGAGSDLASLGTRAVRDGDEFVVTGQKVWNSAAQFCDWAFLLVRTDPDAPKHRGITFVLVDMGSPGIEVRPLVQINGSAHFNEVFLDEVRIPVANVVGEIDAGWSVARTVLANEAAFIGGGPKTPASVNLRTLAEATGTTTDPTTRQELADIITRERVVGWMGEQIQQAIRRGEMPPMDPGLIKLMTAQNKVRTGNLAMRLRGASGLAGDDVETIWSQIELMGRFAISIGGGTNEVLRNNIGERALGLPREPGFSKDQAWKDIPR
ncbi:MAG: acyl-CoA dehydrogenase family protein [Actinomycetota bacterium]